MLSRYPSHRSEHKVLAFAGLVLLFSMLQPAFSAAGESGGKPLLSAAIWVYNSWSAYDELSDDVPLTEELAMRELREIVRFRRLGVHFDYYMMDAFWWAAVRRGGSAAPQEPERLRLRRLSGGAAPACRGTHQRTQSWVNNTLATVQSIAAHTLSSADAGRGTSSMLSSVRQHAGHRECVLRGMFPGAIGGAATI